MSMPRKQYRESHQKNVGGQYGTEASSFSAGTTTAIAEVSKADQWWTVHKVSEDKTNEQISWGGTYLAMQWMSHSGWSLDDTCRLLIAYRSFLEQLAASRGRDDDDDDNSNRIKAPTNNSPLSAIWTIHMSNWIMYYRDCMMMYGRVLQLPAETRKSTTTSSLSAANKNIVVRPTTTTTTMMTTQHTGHSTAVHYQQRAGHETHRQQRTETHVAVNNLTKPETSRVSTRPSSKRGSPTTVDAAVPITGNLREAQNTQPQIASSRLVGDTSDDEDLSDYDNDEDVQQTLKRSRSINSSEAKAAKEDKFVGRRMNQSFDDVPRRFVHVPGKSRAEILVEEALARQSSQKSQREHSSDTEMVEHRASQEEREEEKASEVEESSSLDHDFAEPKSTDSLTIQAICHDAGQHYRFRLDTNTQFGAILEFIANRLGGRDPKSLMFCSDGTSVEANDTVKTLLLDDGDVIDVYDS